MESRLFIFKKVILFIVKRKKNVDEKQMRQEMEM